MESSDATSAREAAAMLAKAEGDRQRLTDELTLPSLFCTSLGIAIAVQIATSATGIARGGAWLAAGLPAGLAVLAIVSVAQLTRFRRANGVWVNGLVSRVVAGTANAASVPYAAAFAGATWAALAGQWSLMLGCAAAGGVAYALAGQYWWRRYRQDPVAHSRGESMVWIAVLVVAAVAGLILVATAR
jgi:hypothetical protein